MAHPRPKTTADPARPPADERSAAAASTAARAPADQSGAGMQQPDASAAVTRQDAGEVRALVQALLRAFSSLLSYPPNSRVLITQKEALATLFDRFLSTRDELRLTVTEEGFHAVGASLPTQQKRAVTLPFLLFNGGVRVVVFHVGVDGEELWSFLQAVKQNAELPEDERDVESLLWEEDFANIEYSVAEEVETEGVGEADGRLRELELPAGQQQAQVELSSLDAAELVSFRARQVASGGGVSSSGSFDVEPAEGIGAFMPWGDEELAEIEQIAEKAQTQRTQEQAADLLADMLELEESEERWTDIIRLMDGFYRDLVQRRDFAGAVRLLTRLRRMAGEGGEPGSAVPGTAPRAQAALDRIMAPAGREVIRETLIQGVDVDSPALEQFLKTIGPEVIPQLCAALPTARDERARELLGKMILTLAEGNVNLIIPVARQCPPPILLEVVPLVGRVPTRDAVRGLGSLRRHGDTRVRLAVVAELVKRDEPEALNYLVSLLDDESVEVRLRALAHLAALENDTAIRRVLGMIDDAGFFGRPRKEQMALVDALDRWKWEGAVDLLARLLVRRRRLGEEDYEPLRRKVASTLWNLGSESALQVVRRGARSWRKSVRQACRQALQEA